LNEKGSILDSIRVARKIRAKVKRGKLLAPRTTRERNEKP